jgi:hypothetical protein
MVCSWRRLSCYQEPDCIGQSTRQGRGHRERERPAFIGSRRHVAHVLSLAPIDLASLDKASSQPTCTSKCMAALIGDRSVLDHIAAGQNLKHDIRGRQMPRCYDWSVHDGRDFRLFDSRIFLCMNVGNSRPHIHASALLPQPSTDSSPDHRKAG